MIRAPLVGMRQGPKVRVTSGRREPKVLVVVLLPRPKALEYLLLWSPFNFS